MEPTDASDNGSGKSSVSTELSECPDGATDLENWADDDDPKFHPRSQDYLEPVPEPLRAPYPPSPQFGPPVYHLPAAQAPSSVFHPTNEVGRVHPHGTQSIQLQPSFTAPPGTPPLYLVPAQAPSSVFHPTNEEVRVHPHGTQIIELQPSFPAPPGTPPLYLVPAQAPSSVFYTTNEEVRVHPHGAQTTEFQVSFAAVPPTPNIPRLSPLEGPREAPGLLEVIPTSPGSDVPSTSRVAGTLPGTLRPPPAQATTALEFTPILVPIGPIFIVTPPVAPRQQGEQAPQSAHPEHLSDPPSDAESNT